MEHIDFVQRVDSYEQARANSQAAFGRHVFGLSMLGVLWVWGSLFIGLALIAWAVLTWVNHGFRGELIVGFFGGLALVTSVARLTRSDWVAPDGIAVPPGECPRLYDALERIRQKTGGPKIHQLVITEDYGLRIVRQARAGGLLPSRYYLLLGLPLAMAIDRPRLMALLAQECGHLRRKQGWLAAWVYRTRRGLQGLHDRLADARQMTHLGWLNERFMRWYLPRWWAASFVVARQDELLADGLAARLVGKAAMGDALSEVAVRGRWFRERFWAMHWARAPAGAGHWPLQPDGGGDEPQHGCELGLPSLAARIPSTRQRYRHPPRPARAAGIARGAAWPHAHVRQQLPGMAGQALSALDRDTGRPLVQAF